MNGGGESSGALSQSMLRALSSSSHSTSDSESLQHGAMSPPSRLSSGDTSLIEKAGWLAKWTNYLKGYRQRWFVLDSNAVLSYYRSQSEVGEACRGSINLAEARVLTDKVTNNIVIAHSTQTFHLKAPNEVDREQWIKSMEYARHKVIREAESDDDEDATLGASRGAATVAGAKQALALMMADLRTSQKLLAKQSVELESFVLESSDGIDRKIFAERIRMLKVATATVGTGAEELCSLSERETRKLEKALASEHSQRVQLQEQLETLAKQHSNLERAAAREKAGTAHSRPFSSASDEEEFYDAEDDVGQDRKSGSSVHQSEASTEEEYFSAEIVSSVRDPSALAVQSPRSSMNSTIPGRRRRSTIPDRPDLPLNLWSIMRNCIGKELSKIPMPVNFSEPLSVLQRITEDLEYAHLVLDEAAVQPTPLEQMCYVAAYAVSSYSTTGNRTTKPFNPLLGETYECDRSDDLGWRSIAEQVSHHPPAAAHHAEGRGWTMYQDFTMTSRFRGKYLSVIPVGSTHVTFPRSGDHYTYKKVTTTVHNIIVGKLWIDNHGDMEITNHKTGDKCTLKFAQYSYFGRDPPRKVHGLVKDKEGQVRYVIQGSWDDHIDCLKVTRASGKGEKSKLETDAPVRMWTVNAPYPGNERMYHFTRLAIELNEEEKGIAPTDSRHRPDQRLMEDGKWDEANKTKEFLEDKQRTKRKRREAEIEGAMQRGEHISEVLPTWFEKTQDELTGSLIHVFKGEYWKAKEASAWENCPEIF